MAYGFLDMLKLDETNARRMAQLTELLRELSVDPDPIRSINRYARQIRRLNQDEAVVSISTRGCPPGSYKVMRFLHQEGVGWPGFTDMLYAGAHAEIRDGGLIGDLIGQDRPLVTRDLCIPDDPIFGNQLAPYRLLVALPIFSEGQALNWVLFLNTEPWGFSDQEIEFKLLQANLMGNSTNSKLATQNLREATAWIQREVDEVASIQMALLPKQMPTVPGLQIATQYQTYDRAGGDYYDILQLGMDPMAKKADPDRPWWIFIADASGHGPSAAVVVAMLSALLHAYEHAPADPGAVLTRLNRHLCSRQVGGSFVTALLLRLDPVTGAFDYANAGHNLPLIRHSDGSITELPNSGGVPLGILCSTHYDNRRGPLSAGERMLLYTDGITEARAPGGSFFGEDGLRACLSQAHGSPQATLDTIQAAVRDFEAGQRPRDDQTMVLIDVHPPWGAST